MNSPTNSNSADDAREAVAALIGVSTQSVTNAQEWRRRKASEIQMHALAAGLDVTVDMVDRQFAWFLRWHGDTISIGYLMRRTGVKKRKQRSNGGE